MQAGGAHTQKRPAPVDDSGGATDSEAGHENSDETWHCNRCDVTKPVGKFAKWAIRSRNHICRSCALVRSREAHELRKGSLDRRLMARMRKSMHRAGFTRSATLKLKLATMQELVQRQGERSILSGIFDLDRLTVARWDGSKPWRFTNLVILTHAEAREHNRRSLGDYHPAYVQHVEHRLLLPPEAMERATEQPTQPMAEDQAARKGGGEDCNSDTGEDAEDTEGAEDKEDVEGAEDTEDAEGADVIQSIQGNVDAKGADDATGSDTDSSVEGDATHGERAEDPSDRVTKAAPKALENRKSEPCCRDPEPPCKPENTPDPSNAGADNAEDRQPVWPPYPPKSSHKRGVTSNTAMWYINNWKIMYPTLRSSLQAARPDLVPRSDVPLLKAVS